MQILVGFLKTSGEALKAFLEEFSGFGRIFHDFFRFLRIAEGAVKILKASSGFLEMS